MTHGLTPLSVTHGLTPLSVTHGLTPLSVTHGLTPLSVTHGLTPLSVTHGLTPLSVTHGLTSMSVTHGLTPLSVTHGLTPLSVTHSIRLKLMVADPSNPAFIHRRPQYKMPYLQFLQQKHIGTLTLSSVPASFFLISVLLAYQNPEKTQVKVDRKTKCRI